MYCRANKQHGTKLGYKLNLLHVHTVQYLGCLSLWFNCKVQELIYIIYVFESWRHYLMNTIVIFQYKIITSVARKVSFFCCLRFDFKRSILKQNISLCSYKAVILKEKSNENFWHFLFHESNPLRPLINRQNWLCK